MQTNDELITELIERYRHTLAEFTIDNFPDSELKGALDTVMNGTLAFYMFVVDRFFTAQKQDKKSWTFTQLEKHINEYLESIKEKHKC